jgi:hypothetical protein
MGHPENGTLERQNIGKYGKIWEKMGKDGKMRKYDHQN